MGKWGNITQATLIYICLTPGVLSLVILLLLYEHKGFFFYCITWFAAFQFPVLLWLYKMWNICDCLVLRWCDHRALFSSVEEMKGCAHCEQLLRKKERNPILSCSTEVHTGLIGYWFQFRYGENTFLATNMCSHMLSCKCENCINCKALWRAVLSLSIWKAEDLHFSL